MGKLRGSVLLLGPLLARRGAARLAQPGGDFPARRTIGTHLQALDCARCRRPRRAGLRPRRAGRIDRSVLLPGRGVGHRDGDGAPRSRCCARRHRDPARGNGAARRRALSVPPCDGRIDRGRGNDDDPSQGTGAASRRPPFARRRLHRSRELGRSRGDNRRRHRSHRSARQRHGSRRGAAPQDGPALRDRRRALRRRTQAADRPRDASRPDSGRDSRAT